MYSCVLTYVFPLVIAYSVRTIVNNAVVLRLRGCGGVCQVRSSAIATHSSSVLGLLSV